MHYHEYTPPPPYLTRSPHVLTGYPKLIDLGLAKKIPHTATLGGEAAVDNRSYSLGGAILYSAPELISGRLARTGHGQSVDQWALGVRVSNGRYCRCTAQSSIVHLTISLPYTTRLNAVCGGWLLTLRKLCFS